MTSPVTYTESAAPSFLFDLDGTLIDSVYQHVIAWRTALAGMGIDLSVWRNPPAHRDERRPVRFGAAAGDRALAVAGGDRPAAAGARRRVPGPDGFGTAAARSSGPARLPHRMRYQVGHRDQRERGDGPSGAEAARAAGKHPHGHPGPGPARQARPGPVPGGGGAAERRSAAGDGRRETASGTCSRPGGPGHSASACCPAGTAGRNWNEPGATASTAIRPTCWPTWTRWASGVTRTDARPTPGGQPELARA